MPSDLHRIAQGLIECLDQVPQIVAHLQQTAVRLRQQASWIADLSGSNPYGRQAALLLHDAAQRCDEAAYRASLAPLKATVWAQTMVSGARVAAPASEPGNVRPSTASRASSAEGNAGRSTAGRTSSRLTAFQAAAIMARLPKRVERPGHRPKTRGIWIDENGRDHALVSGRDVHQRQANELAAAKRLGRPPPFELAITSHVEIKFAMMMRERGLRDGSIVINSRPCAGEAGCDALLPYFVPEGGSLTVFGPDGFSKIYRGRSPAQ